MLFADDVTTFHAILVDNCILLQFDTENIPYLCTVNRMKLNSSKTRFTAYIKGEVLSGILLSMKVHNRQQ
jgi:hypothetical protein